MSLAKQLARWRGNVVLWAEEVLWTKDPTTGTLGPLKLQEHQRNFLREATRRGSDGHFIYKVAVASWPKREGKTLQVAIILAWRLCCFTNQRCGVLANSERQAASNIFDAVTGFFKDSPTLQGLVPDDCLQTRKLTVPALDNVVECFPCNHRTVQGTRFDLLCCDELHASDDGGKAYTFASQQTEAADAQTLISSQAGAPVEANPLWRLYRAAETEAHILFSYRQEPVTPWAVERAEKARAELLPGEYDYLWRNAWGATGLKLISAEDIEAACLDFTEPRTREEWQALLEGWNLHKTPCAIGVGLDRAGVGASGDRTVWTVTARFDRESSEPLFITPACWVLPTGAEAEVLDCDRRTRAIFGTPGAHHFESYGCSDVVEKVRGAELCSPTNPRQASLYNTLYRLFRERRIGFAEKAGMDPAKGIPGLLKAELIQFEYSAERGGQDGGALTRFGTQKGHDDTCYSLAWSVEAAAASRAGGNVRRQGSAVQIVLQRRSIL